MSPQAENSFYHFFGIGGSPFSIAPDPHYLYLGDKHQEALAHLFYGIGNAGGFIVLTGEVGTGKTTICRTILQQMPEGTDVAYIVNPRLTANELLQIVCDELGLFYNTEERTNKVLLDILTKYLLASHSRGRHNLLIIDEAQNLSADVLEQIRLLTNLETDEKKLLQLVLIGQPELGQMLASTELRQLSQRVTARYHLQALSCAETAVYVAHRLKVAGFPGPLFTPGAIRRIYRHTRGTPRLINVLCERCMLGAYVTESRSIDRRIVRRAIRELQEPERRSRGGRAARLAGTGSSLLRVAMPLSVLLLVALALNLAYQHLQPESRAPLSATRPISHASTPLPANRDQGPEEDELHHRQEAALAAREQALRKLAQRWQLPIGSDPVCGNLRELGLSCLEVELTAAQLLQLGLPAVVEFVDQVPAETLLLESERDLARLRERAHATARVWLFWRQPPSGGEVWPYQLADEHPGIAWLQQRLAWREGRPSYWSGRHPAAAAPVPGRFQWLFEGTQSLSSASRGRDFDAQTAAALSELQQSLGWEATGKGDLLTLLKLDYLTNSAAPALVRSG